MRKESAEEWLDVHRTWHKMGGPFDLHDADWPCGEKEAPTAWIIYGGLR